MSKIRPPLHIARQLHSHCLRHVSNQLAAQVAEPARSSPLVRELASCGCRTSMHVVRLVVPQLIVDYLAVIEGLPIDHFVFHYGATVSVSTVASICQISAIS